MSGLSGLNGSLTHIIVTIYIITVNADAVDEILNKIDVPVAIIGEVKGAVLKLGDNEFTIDELNDSYHGVIEKYMA